MREMRLGYLDHGIEIEIVAELQESGTVRQEEIAVDLADRLRAALSRLSGLSLRPAGRVDPPAAG